MLIPDRLQTVDKVAAEVELQQHFSVWMNFLVVFIKECNISYAFCSFFASFFKVSAKYSCGFSIFLVSSIIVGERYLDYFTTITEDRL